MVIIGGVKPLAPGGPGRVSWIGVSPVKGKVLGLKPRLNGGPEL